MTEALILLCICASIACTGIGFAGFGIFIALYRLNGSYLIRQTFDATHYPNGSPSSMDGRSDEDMPRPMTSARVC